VQGAPEEAADVLGHGLAVGGERRALDGLEGEPRRRRPARERLVEDRTHGIEVSGRRRFSRGEDLRSDVRRERLPRARVAQRREEARAEAMPENARLSFVRNADEGRHEEAVGRAGETLDGRSDLQGGEQPLRDEQAVLHRQRRAEEACREKLVERAPLDVCRAQERRVVDGAHHRPARDGGALDFVHQVHRGFHREEKRGPVDRGRRERAHEEERLQPGGPRRAGPPGLSEGVHAEGAGQQIRPERPRARCGGAHELSGSRLLECSR